MEGGNIVLSSFVKGRSKLQRLVSNWVNNLAEEELEHPCFHELG